MRPVQRRVLHGSTCRGRYGDVSAKLGGTHGNFRPLGTGVFFIGNGGCRLSFTSLETYIPLYAEAAVLTARLALWGILLSLVTGLAVGIIRYEKIPVLSQIASAYIELSRNTPLLVQLFFLYFGLPKLGIRIPGEACAVIGLAFLGGSYMAEAFRSGIESVTVSQIESAEALGLSRYQLFRYVILLQALEVSIPPICANVLFLIKETSVFSVVAVADLMYVAKDLIGLYYKTDEALLLLVLSYLIMLLPISLGASVLERRIRHGRFGNPSTV